MGLQRVVDRRREEREKLVARARAYAKGLPRKLGVVGVAVFGSVARGDFNLWSDVDVLVVAGELPDRLLERLDAIAPWPDRLQPVVWTPGEWHDRVARDDPIATEAARRGVWVRGGPPSLPS